MASFVDFVVRHRGMTPSALQGFLGNGFLLLARNERGDVRLGDDLPTHVHENLLGGIRQGLGRAEVYALRDLIDARSSVTIGSSETCAIVIDAPSVASLHAWFHFDADQGRFELEAASYNARTIVEGKILRPGVRQPLRGGEDMSFGVPFQATYHTARSVIWAMKLAERVAGAED